jgi:hypothetical protein
MAVGKGATSLVELILKKFGDDTDGAAKELERLGGFPESVSQRIASGELPMDSASVAKRADEQGYSDTMYHGSKSDFKEIDPEMSGSEHGMSTDTGFWVSESPDLASTYAGGVVDNNPLIYPIRVKQGDQLEVDLGGSSWQDIDTDSRVINNGDDYGSIESWDDSIFDTNELAFMAKDAGADSLKMRNVVDPGDDANVHVELMRMFPELEKMPSGSRERREFMRNITDEEWQEAKRIGNERAYKPATNVVTFDPNSVRSPNAAFDPQYKGSNMMGNADPRLLAGTAAGTAGLLAAPALMKDEPVDPTAPLPAPAFGEQMGKAGEVLMTILDAPMTGWQGIARGLSGVMNGEDVVTAGAEANHMMKGGSEEGFDRLGDKVEGLLSPIDKRFPYLNTGKSAGDTVGLLASLIAPF